MFLRAVLSLTLLLPLGAVAATSCGVLANLPLENTTVTVAEEVTTGSFIPPGASTPLTGLPVWMQSVMSLCCSIGVTNLLSSKT